MQGGVVFKTILFSIRNYLKTILMLENIFKKHSLAHFKNNFDSGGMCFLNLIID
jgi:penicillin-binding protein-related factor A (putative recombinase)